jgi:limonene-1,2-epoxide hydrolase
VGHDAIREEMQRQAPHFSALHCEILNIAPSGSTVFVQRLDSMMTKNGPLNSHLVAVFEVEPDGWISSWREYYDSKEITTQVGTNMTTSGQRA